MSSREQRASRSRLKEVKEKNLKKELTKEDGCGRLNELSRKTGKNIEN